MKHLTAQQLNEHLDGKLPEEQVEEVRAHLESCEECRRLVEEFVAQGEEIRRAIQHDPGEAYFDTFASRVMDRITAERAAAHPERGRAAGPAWLRALTAPRTIAAVGGALAILVVAGIAFIQWQGRPSLESLLGRSKAPTGATRSAPAPAISARGSAPAEDERADVGTPAAGQEGALGAPATGAPAAEGLVAKKEDAATNTMALDDAKSATSAPGEPDRARAKLRAFAPAPSASAIPPPAATPDHPSGGARAREVRPNEAGEPTPVPSRAEQAFREAAGSRTTASGTTERVTKPRPGALAPAPAAQKIAEEAQAGSADAPLSFAKDAVGSRRLCGVVRDPRGRPVPGALVAVAEAGRSTTAGADGSFCIDAPAGRATLTALAVGFETSRTTFDASSGPLAIVLSPVSAITPDHPSGGAPATRLVTPEKRPAATTPLKAQAPAADPFEGESAATRAEVARARQQAGIAGRERTAAAWEQAAGDWARVLARVRGVASGDEARFRVAEARFRAWEASPDARRARMAEEALTSYLVRAPIGPARDQASRWAQELSH